VQLYGEKGPEGAEVAYTASPERYIPPGGKEANNVGKGFYPYFSQL